VFDTGTLCAMREEGLRDELACRVADRLGLGDVRTDLEGTRALYAAWCRHVPFDNLRKLGAVRRGERPLPGDDPNDFFDAWLQHGSGATCWASANALHALATALGFDAVRAAGSMLDLPDPNHGTVIVTAEDTMWLLDSSLQTGEPLPLGPAAASTSRCGYHSRIEPDGDTWMLYVPSVRLPELPCRIRLDVRTGDNFAAMHEATRTQGVFNATPYVLRHGRDSVMCLNDHRLTTWTTDGHCTEDLDDAERREWLTSIAGFSDDLVNDALSNLPEPSRH
jgi:N-hydroxyarylamine O-acetyltransferase